MDVCPDFDDVILSLAGGTNCEAVQPTDSVEVVRPDGLDEALGPIPPDVRRQDRGERLDKLETQELDDLQRELFGAQLGAGPRT